MLKSQLDEAILRHQTELFIHSLSPESSAQVCHLIDDLIIHQQRVNLEADDWEAAYEQVIEKMQNQIHNLTLCKMYDYGSTLSYADKKPHWSKRRQTAATFIFEYFEGIPEAILLLNQVTYGQIIKLTRAESNALLEPRHKVSGRSTVLGQDSVEADDLWAQVATSTSDDLHAGALFTAEPPSKKSRHSPAPLQPPTSPQPLSAADLATIFECDFDLPRDLTIPLDLDSQPIKRSLKRKHV
jgi:hypothetical protein